MKPAGRQMAKSKNIITKNGDENKSCLVCIYHHNDPDGYLSEFYIRRAVNTDSNVFNLAFGTNYRRIDIVSMPKGYNDEFCDLHVPSKTSKYNDIILFFVDLSFTEKTRNKIETAININRKLKRVVWIDHHESSIELAKKLKYEDWFCLDDYCLTLIDTRACGAALCSYFYGMMKYITDEYLATVDTLFPIPKNLWNKYLIEGAIDIVVDDKNSHIVFNNPSDDNLAVNELQRHGWITDEFVYNLDSYDRWTNSNPNANSFLYGLKTLDFRHIEEFYNPEEKYKNDELTKEIITKGNTVLDYLNMQYDFEAKDIYYDTILGFKFAFKNGMGNSLNFNDMLKNNECDAAIIYHYDPKANKWAYSIYGNRALTLRVNLIAEGFDGGGHPGAAGFNIEENITGYVVNGNFDKFMLEKYPAAYTAIFSQCIYARDMIPEAIMKDANLEAITIYSTDLTESGLKRLIPYIEGCDSVGIARSIIDNNPEARFPVGITYRRKKRSDS